MSVTSSKFALEVTPAAVVAIPCTAQSQVAVQDQVRTTVNTQVTEDGRLDGACQQ